MATNQAIATERASEAAIDPITFEVLRNAFEYTCARMTTIVQKTSFSPILSDMLDFSNAIYDCLLYTSPSPRDRTRSRMPSSA